MPVDDLDLERIVLGLEELHGLGLRHLLADDGVVLGDDPLHLGLDLLEVFGRERPARVEVVIEAVLDGRADADLHAREEALDGVRAEVRRGVAVQLERVRVLRRDDLEGAGRPERAGKVENLAGELHGQRVLGEAGPDRLGHGTARRARRDFAHGTIGQRQTDISAAFSNRRVNPIRARHRGHTKPSSLLRKIVFSSFFRTRKKFTNGSLGGERGW